MKKTLYLLLLFMLFKLPLMAQTPYWAEEFDTGQGWALDNNWAIANGKMQFFWSPTITNFDLSAVSPIITLPENTQELIVTQYLDVFGYSSPSEVAQIIIISEGDESLLWDHELAWDNWGAPGGTELILDISDFSGQDIQFKFRTFGPTTYEWNWWDIFRLEVTVMLDTDLTVTNVEGPIVIDITETGQWDMNVKNLGSLPQSDFTLKLFSFKFGDLIGTIDITEAINPGETKAFTFDWTPSIAQNTALYGIVIKDGDEYEQNNMSGSHFVRVNPDIDFNILVWDNDNSIGTILDPENGDMIQPSTGLTRALDAAGLNYDYCTSLPDDLFEYEILYSTMGCYCMS